MDRGSSNSFDLWPRGWEWGNLHLRFPGPWQGSGSGLRKDALKKRTSECAVKEGRNDRGQAWIPRCSHGSGFKGIHHLIFGICKARPCAKRLKKGRGRPRGGGRGLSSLLQQPGEAALPSRGSLWTQDGDLQLIDSGSQGPETQPPPSSPGPPTSPCPALTSMHPTPACPQKCGAAALSSLFPPGASTCPCPLLCPTSSFPPLGGRLHGTACRKPCWCLWSQWPQQLWNPCWTEGDSGCPAGSQGRSRTRCGHCRSWGPGDCLA